MSLSAQCHDLVFMQALNFPSVKCETQNMYEIFIDL